MSAAATEKTTIPTMTTAEALAELRAIRVRVDQIAAVLVGQQEREELMPVWDCGHRHVSRQAAVECKRAQQSAA